MRTNATHLTSVGEKVPERRKHPRKGTFWHAQLQAPAGDFECRVMNLSPRGARIEIDHPLADGQVVTLIMEPLGEFKGVVAWRRKRSLGIQISEYRTTRTDITLPRWVTYGEAVHD